LRPRASSSLFCSARTSRRKREREKKKGRKGKGSRHEEGGKRNKVESEGGYISFYLIALTLYVGTGGKKRRRREKRGKKKGCEECPLPSFAPCYFNYGGEGLRGEGGGRKGKRKTRGGKGGEREGAEHVRAAHPPSSMKPKPFRF